MIKKDPPLITSKDSNNFITHTTSIESFENFTSSKEKHVSPSEIKTISSSPNNAISNSASMPWYQTYKAPLVVGGILLGACVLATIPTAIGVVLSRNPDVSDTSTTTTATRSIWWNFDTTVNDNNSAYLGTSYGAVSYSATNYFGSGTALYLNPPATAYVAVPSPFFNLSYTSFTLEAWIYLTNIVGDNPIFTQCDCSSCTSRCLSLLIRSGKLYMSFSTVSLMGSTSLVANTWYHVAFVYDYAAQTQSVYLQGVLDGSRTSTTAYQGDNSTIYIGVSNISSNSFRGCIDDMRLSTQAKSASEVLKDASLVAYFSFDGSFTTDSGPNKIAAYVSAAASVSGKVGQAMSLGGSATFFQAYAFYQLTQTNKEFSIALWVNPSVASGVLIQKTRFQSTTSLPACYLYMSFSTLGQIIFTLTTATTPTYVTIVGPFISTGTWTHLGYTYSATNGAIMYINGGRYGSTGSANYGVSSNYDWLNIGQNVSTCSTSAGTNGYFVGSIDELYIYRRELSASEVAALANY